MALKYFHFSKLDFMTSRIADLNRPASVDLLERIYLLWSAEIFGFTCKFDDLIVKPESLNRGFNVKPRFTNPGFSTN